MLSLLFLLSVECPEGYTCLSNEQYAEVYSKIEEYADLEESIPTITFDGQITILTDSKGRVLSDTTGTRPIPGDMSWGVLSADLELLVDVDVRRAEEPVGGFRLRPKFTTSWLIFESYQILEDPMRMLDIGVALDFLYYRRWNLNVSGGVRSFGGGIGFDLFDNSGVLLDVRWPFELSPQPTPAVGWYFTF